MTGFRKFGPLSYSVMTDIDQTIVMSHIIRLSVWRFCFEASFKTQASVDNDRHRRAWGRLFDQAVKVWGNRDHVLWSLDDHREDGGTRESVMALMQRIVDGIEMNPWTEAEASA